MLRSTQIKSPKEGLKIKTKTNEECDKLIKLVKEGIESTKYLISNSLSIDIS